MTEPGTFRKPEMGQNNIFDSFYAFGTLWSLMQGSLHLLLSQEKLLSPSKTM